MNVLRLLQSCAVILAYACGAGFAHAQDLDAIFVSQSTGDIDNIDTTTGDSNTLATLGTANWNGAAFDPQNDEIYIDDIGRNGYTANQAITNTIYEYNPFTNSGPTLVGTITGQAAFTGGGFFNGLYYVIPTGSDQLIAYSISGNTITQVSSQTLGGLGRNVSGLSLGDLDFVGSTLYISANTVNGTNISGDYTLYKYANVANTSAGGLTYAVAESDSGVGIGYDASSGQLIMFNSDGTIQTIDQATGTESGSITLSGPALAAGAGDFTIVPEPRMYAFWLLALGGALAVGHRALGRRLRADIVQV